MAFSRRPADRGPFAVCAALGRDGCGCDWRGARRACSSCLFATCACGGICEEPWKGEEEMALIFVRNLAVRWRIANEMAPWSASCWW